MFQRYPDERDATPENAARILRRAVDNMEVPTIQGDENWYTENEIGGWLSVAQGDDVYATEVHADLAKRAFAREPSVDGLEHTWDSLPDNDKRTRRERMQALIEDLADLGVIGRAGDNGGLIDTDGVSSFMARMSPRLALAIADLLEGTGSPEAIARAVIFPSETQEPPRF